MKNHCRGMGLPCTMLAATTTGLAWFTPPAHAQFGVRPNSGEPASTPTTGNATTGAALDLPKGITKIISIDKDNTLLVEVTDPDDPTNHQYLLIPIQHLYSGGFSKMFGGGTLPTAMFVSPAAQGASGANNSGTGNRTQAPNSGSQSGSGVSQFTPGKGSSPGTTAPFGTSTGISQIISTMQLTPKSTTR